MSDARSGPRRARPEPAVVGGGPEDAAGVADLYRCVYSIGAVSAESLYPFPQVMDRAWLARALANPRYAFVLARDGERYAGAIATRFRRVPGARPHAEVFGLVVAPDYRRMGLGGRLLEGLHRRIASRAEIATGEMRAGPQPAARTVRKSFFEALGFAPFSHRMVDGWESMTVIGWMAGSAVAERSRAGACTAAVHALAETVLSPLGLEPLAPRSAVGCGAEGGRPLPRELSGETRGRVARLLRSGHDFLLEPSGLPALDRGLARSSRRWFATDDPPALLSLAENSHDAKFELGPCSAATPAACHALIGALVNRILEERGAEPCTLVAQVPAPAWQTQELLEALGFAPAAYLPAAHPMGDRRVDVVQYVRLHACDMALLRRTVQNLAWTQARRIARHVGVLLGSPLRD